MVGHGADELIDLVMRLFIEPGDAVINCPPTFGMYAFDAGVNGGRLINIRRRPDFSIDMEEVEALFTPPSIPPLKRGERKDLLPSFLGKGKGGG